MNQQCFEGQHLVFALVVGVPGLLFGVLAPPILMFCLLYKERGAKLYDDRTKMKYLFLYHPYKDEYYFWEAAKMVFLLSLVCVRVLGTLLNSLERLSIFLLLLVGFLFLVVGLRPHHFKTVYYFEICSLGITLAATYII